MNIFTRVNKIDYKIWYARNGERDVYDGFMLPAMCYVRLNKARRFSKVANYVLVTFIGAVLMAVMSIVLGVK